MRFEIGQVVWHAMWDSTHSYVTCPDCGGTGRLRVIMHDNTEVSIECRNCSVGYDPPTGHVKVYDRRPYATYSTVTGVEINGTTTRWHLSDHYLADDADVFATGQEAMAAAAVKAEKADREERERVFKKEKDTRSWAWNANYHRQCIRRAQKDIEYHTSKLTVAEIKAKEDKRRIDQNTTLDPP